MKTTLPAATLAASLLAASACSALPFTDETEAYELVTGDTESSWCAPEDDSRRLESGADLRGPHFALSLMCSYTGTAIPDPIAADVAALGELPEPESDTEFVLAQFALADTYDPEAETEQGDVAAWIEAGERELELEALPVPGGYVAVAVPVGEAAVLWVEDDGRAQGLDLRTGAQVDPVAAYYNGLSTEPVVVDEFAYEDVTILNGTDAYRLACGSDTLQGHRAVWREDRGWAAEGTVHLEVSFSWCGYEDPGIAWHLDEAALTVETGDDVAEALSWEAIDLGEEFDGDTRHVAVFAIPEDAAAATLVFTPVGDLENLDGGDDYAFLDTPEPIERELAF